MDHSKSPPEFKKRILRTVLKEIIASSDGDQGGYHTELTLQKTRTRFSPLVWILLDPIITSADITNRTGDAA